MCKGLLTRGTEVSVQRPGHRAPQHSSLRPESQRTPLNCSKQKLNEIEFYLENISVENSLER